MPELIRFIKPQFQSIVWEINETIDELYLKIILSEKELSYYQILKTENRRKQWLAYRIALLGLNDFCHYSIDYNEIGKPFFIDRSTHMSVSHSGRYAQAIVSEKNRVGVDVEVVSETAFKVRHKFMSESELILIDKIDPNHYALFVWCGKEAIYKAMGKLGVIFAEDIQMFDFDFQLMNASALFFYNNKTVRFKVFFYQNHDFVSAMCYEIIE